MLKVGLIGLGFMGRGHLEQYERLMSEGAPVKLVALCDVDPKKFDPSLIQAGNLGDLGAAKYDFSKYNLYNDFNDMIAAEQLDVLDVTLPTYLHCYYTCRALDAGLHVLCEKPMALDPDQCDLMVDAAKESGKSLMVAQCLRFWPAYETLKKYIDRNEFGAPVSAYFYRGGGGAPQWSYQDWELDEHRNGGCLLDQHVHDVDLINYLYGMPLGVSTLARNVYPGAGYDAVSTHYLFEDDFIVNAQDDWSMSGAPFTMSYRVNMERGALVLENNVVTVYPINGESFVADDSGDSGYYREIKYFIETIEAGGKIEICAPESTRDSIRIAAAEHKSAKHRGEWVKVGGCSCGCGN